MTLLLEWRKLRYKGNWEEKQRRNNKTSLSGTYKRMKNEIIVKQIWSYGTSEAYAQRIWIYIRTHIKHKHVCVLLCMGIYINIDMLVCACVCMYACNKESGVAVGVILPLYPPTVICNLEIPQIGMTWITMDADEQTTTHSACLSKPICWWR